MNEMLDSTFPAPTLEEWERKAEQSLKGKPLQTLLTTTFEGIPLKPLYTEKDEQSEYVSQFPGQVDFRRGIDPLGYIQNDWLIAQKMKFQVNKDLNKQLISALEKGQATISFEITAELISQLACLEAVHTKIPYSLNAKEWHADIINEVSKCANHLAGSGFIAKDPLALFVEKGAETDSVAAHYDELFQSVDKAGETLPNIRTILIDTTPYHNGGAHAVQELAVAMSTAVCHIEQFLKRGKSIDFTLSKFVFHFSVGASFFMEIAKLRAARILWNKIAEAYQANETNRKMVIAASTSQFTKTVYDPHVNILRSSNEAFAAVLGGVQYLHVTPFNEPDGDDHKLANRIARNTQHILKEEALLTKTVDPAGGSWYVEWLTTELAEKAWQLFLELDEQGGIIESLKSGSLQNEIASVRNKREHAVMTKEQIIVGTNKYEMSEEKPLNHKRTYHAREEKYFIEPIPQVRLTEAYEQQRKASVNKEEEVESDE